MRVLQSGDSQIKVRASNLVYTIFYQEFNSNLSDELKHIEVAAQQKAALDAVANIDDSTISALIKANGIDPNDSQDAMELLAGLRIADNPMALSGLIAMSQGNVSQSLPIESIMKVTWAMNCAEESGVPAYDQWVRRYQDFDFVNTFDDLLAEIQRGFFRSETKE